MEILKALHGVTSCMTAEDGTVESCLLGEANTVQTVCGAVIPKWQEDIRKKEIPSVSFYPDGALKSVALEKQTTVTTPLGDVPAEFLTFYPSGELRRIFPCNGKLSAYWEEKDEAELCPSLSFSLPVGAFHAKITAIHFYPGGALRSMSFWPNETVILRVFQGLMPTRIGVSLYEDGSIESVEPPYPMDIATPIGTISAFDPDALGIHGDANSLAFYQDGSLRSITTTGSKIEIITPERQSIFFGPTVRPDPLSNDCTVVVPVRIAFTPDSVTLENGVEKRTFSLTDCCFRVFTVDGDPAAMGRTNCGDCASCNLCG